MYVSCVWPKIGTPFGGEGPAAMAAKGGEKMLEFQLENQQPNPRGKTLGPKPF